MAEEKDIKAVGLLYDSVLDWEAAHTNYTNWQKGMYPTERTAAEAWKTGTLYVAEEEGNICGAVILNHIQPFEYGKISWKYPAEESRAFVIHTLAIHPAYRGRGLAREMVRFAEELARKKECLVVRLDTYVGNGPAMELYQSMGYALSGRTDFLFQGFLPEELYCLEKKL
nr:GNAT family N-acetyltransferase [Anaerotignum lactatifermentans]